MSEQETIDGYSTFGECEKIKTTIQNLENENYRHELPRWKIWFDKAENDQDLIAFINKKYGQACQLGEKKPTNQDGVYNINVLGDQKHLENSQCPMNYATVLKYYPKKELIISWDLGQSPTFHQNENYSSPVDQEMLESFKFLN